MAPAETFVGSPRATGSRGAQWTDIDDDGRPDLFLANAYGADQLWRNNGDGTFTNQWGRSASAGDHAAGSIGGDWADHNNDGTLDLLLPTAAGLQSAREGGPEVGVLRGDDSRKRRIEYDYRQSSAVWADVDNDGLLDFVSTVSSSCHEAKLYRQQPNGEFAQSSFEYGISGLAIGHDAVWVDYDNDGKLDLATFVDGRFRLYRNTAPSVNQSLSIELSDAAGRVTSNVGARITVHSGNRRFSRIATSGRGLLMQEPMRLTIGLGSEQQVDSVVIEMPGALTRRMVFTDIEVGQLNRLTVGSSAGAVSASGAHLAGAYPNPFSSSLTITFTVSSAQSIRIDIYDLKGVRLATIADARFEKGEHTAVWTARDHQGQPMPQGAYIYRLSGGGKEQVGRAVLKR